MSEVRGTGLSRREFLVAGAAAGILSGCRSPIADGVGCASKRWYKGALHCHTYWSDGRAFPEQAARWYRDHGYQFVALTDHNVFAENPSRWLKEKAWPEADRFVDEYLRDFPEAEWRTAEGGEREIRLKTFAELSRTLNDPGRFLLLPGCEMTHWCTQQEADMTVRLQLHMNVVGRAATPAHLRRPDFNFNDNKTWGRENTSVADYIAELSRSAPADAYFALNHPVWGWYDVQPEDLIANPAVRFFEVCNNGSSTPPPRGVPADGFDTDRFWDIVNAFRARRGESLLLGTGTDDAHYYFGKPGQKSCLAGDAWTSVRADELSQKAILAALASGDFIACEGVSFSDVRFDPETNALQVAVEAIPDRRLTVEFIVSKRDFSEKPVKVLKVHPENAPKTRRTINLYDKRIGCVASKVVSRVGEPIRASYVLQPDDLYVRARLTVAGMPICGDYLHPQGCLVSWTQPYAFG